MIDVAAARREPERFRAALARKGAAEEFDLLLEVDERWRALIPHQATALPRMQAPVRGH